MKTTSKRRALALVGCDPSPQPIPKWVLSPLATETLVEALPMCDQPHELRAEVMPLCVPGENNVAGLLVRVTSGAEVTHERAFSAHPWCLSEWAPSTTAESGCGSHGCGLTLVEADGVSPHLFALPEVAERPLEPLLAGAVPHGQPAQSCPAALDASAWQEIVRCFRGALPDEEMLLLRGSLSICRDSGRAFTYVTRADPTAGHASPDAVSATAGEVADALVQGSGQFVGLAHSHPVTAPQGRVVVSSIDLETFRKRLRWAGAISLIANVPTDGAEPEPVVIGWHRGGPAACGFWVTGGERQDE